MAKKSKFGIQVEGFDELMAKLDKIGGSPAMKKGVDEALIKSKEYVTNELDKAIVKLPAKGKYSTGATKRSLDKSSKVDWSGLVASTKVGFNLKESGLTSIYLMYGTPKMKPVKGLKSAVYGAKSKKEVTRIQSEAINKVINDIMGG